MLKSLFLCQRIKANQIQKQLREEKDVLADHVTSLNTHRETQSQMLKKMDERERVLQHAVVGTKRVAVQNQDRFRSKSAQKPVASSFFLNFILVSTLTKTVFISHSQIPSNMWAYFFVFSLFSFLLRTPWRKS